MTPPEFVAATQPNGETGWVHYLPIATTLVAVPFVASLAGRYRAKDDAPHLLWWAIGVACFGLGTALESSITLFGNSALLNKLWYVAGALLGAYPLAQGTVYLLLQRRIASVLTRTSLPFVIGLAAVVLASPVDAEVLESHRPSGAVLEWTWVRYLTPFINLYAVVFLVGGALLSAWRFARAREDSGRVVGNALIAAGAILPAIGGTMAKSGRVEALYVAELAGLLLIWAGFRWCTRSPAPQSAG